LTPIIWVRTPAAYPPAIYASELVPTNQVAVSTRRLILTKRTNSEPEKVRRFRPLAAEDYCNHRNQPRATDDSWLGLAYVSAPSIDDLVTPAVFGLEFALGLQPVLHVMAVLAAVLHPLLVGAHGNLIVRHLNGCFGPGGHRH